MNRRYFAISIGIALSIGLPACGSGGGVPSVSGPVAPKLELVATEMRYTPPKVAVAAGDIPVILRNEGRVIHDVHVEKMTYLYTEAAPGQTSTTSWKLGKGRYRIFCALAGHRAAGMEGILEVR